MKKYIIKTLIIVVAALCYYYLITKALAYIPYYGSPEWFKSVFQKGWHGSMGWIIIRHKLIVIAVSLPIGLILTNLIKDKLIISAIIVGIFPAIYGQITDYMSFIKYGLVRDFAGYIRYHFAYNSGLFGWMLITDFIIITVSVPLVCWVFSKYNLVQFNKLSSVKI